MQIISESQKTRGIEAKKMALIYLKPFIEACKREEILILEQRPRGDVEHTFFRFKDALFGQEPIIVHKFIVANNKTDSMHVFTFESPADTWKENWERFGTPFLSKTNILINVPSY